MSGARSWGKVLWERGGMETNSASLMCAKSWGGEVNLRGP